MEVSEEPQTDDRTNAVRIESTHAPSCNTSTYRPPMPLPAAQEHIYPVESSTASRIPEGMLSPPVRNAEVGGLSQSNGEVFRKLGAAKTEVAVVKGIVGAPQVSNLRGTLPFSSLLLCHFAVAAFVHLQAAIHVVFLIHIYVPLPTSCHRSGVMPQLRQQLSRSIGHPLSWNHCRLNCCVKVRFLCNPWCAHVMSCVSINRIRE